MAADAASNPRPSYIRGVRKSRKTPRMWEAYAVKETAR
jgi:hypothetical protein